MLTMKIYEGKDGIFEKLDDAINYMKESNFEKEISVYAIDSKKAYKKTQQIYEVIKEYNKGKPLDEQILPSNPFRYRGILGCLGVQVYAISLGTYKKNHNLISLFSRWNESVLDTSIEEAYIAPGTKAMSSLALMGSMMHG